MYIQLWFNAPPLLPTGAMVPTVAKFTLRELPAHHVGSSHNVNFGDPTMHFLARFILDLFLEEPEDDSIGVETLCLKNSNIIIKFVVLD